ncbi:hypothetical protein EQG49_00940 [Periweissella cryptocerci]|uniref:Uncharacterized protein n=1 Tax=Periweissella cryptocerci TaxID=2506420 RepID=A0A4P6YR76_9LACO|nr:hypothetical protein [Periweissella cryptocerci]QBO35120.1 hypothetical protein EQG49_00940 [Periweissella cryptocerci]
MLTIITFIIGTILILLSLFYRSQAEIVANGLNMKMITIANRNRVVIALATIALISAVLLPGVWNRVLLLVALVLIGYVLLNANQRLKRQIASLVASTATNKYRMLSRLYLDLLGLGLLVYFVGLVY